MKAPLILTNVHTERDFEGTGVRMRFSPALNSVYGYGMHFAHGNTIDQTIEQLEKFAQGLKWYRDCYDRHIDPSS